MVQIKEVQQVLPNGLLQPDLEILRATEVSYQCMLLQPRGPIYAGNSGVRGLDSAENSRKAKAFLDLAVAKGAHLAVTPEYFFPWATLRELVQSGLEPADDALWVLGCESITGEQLEEFRDSVAVQCEVIYEPLNALANDRDLLDGVVLAFKARKSDGATRLVILVQFKTFPSRDNVFFEESRLKRGTSIYRFNGPTGPLSAAVFICSDALDMKTDDISKLVDRSTLIHIQLNPDPRHSTYRQYRTTAFEIDTDMSKCHIVCLNWASAIVQHGDGGDEAPWPVIGGSAWYCPDSRCSYNDDIVVPNHEHGLYYTYMRERRHALFFDYDEAVFVLQVPKVVTGGKALLANQNGPSATHRYEWNVQSVSWSICTKPANTGFETLLTSNPHAKAALADIGDASVLDIERLLALSAGAVSAFENWFTAKELDSCRIEPDEIVRRVTIVQDVNASAVQFRHARLDAVAHVRQELDSRQKWPPQVDGINADARILWDPGSKNFNVLSSDGRPSLVAYIGESPCNLTKTNIVDNLTSMLRRAGGAYQRRLCILYRRFGVPEFADLDGLTRFDDALEDETDILSINPLSE